MKGQWQSLYECWRDADKRAAHDFTPTFPFCVLDKTNADVVIVVTQYTWGTWHYTVTNTISGWKPSSCSISDDALTKANDLFLLLDTDHPAALDALAACGLTPQGTKDRGHKGLDYSSLKKSREGGLNPQPQTAEPACSCTSHESLWGIHETSCPYLLWKKAA